VTPFGPGSVSLRLYPHNDLPAPTIVEELRAQAALAANHGFDGVMTSEHHGGFAGYLPNPLQQAGWCLEAMTTGWAAPCPLLLTLRPHALVAEEAAWLAARFPDRVGLGVAAGALADDFAVMGLAMDDLGARFTAALEALVGMLNGTDPNGLADDPAVKACAACPVPVLSAAMSKVAARRAARLGVGLLFDSLSTPQRCRELSDAYRAAGGTGPSVMIRRVWIGTPPRELMEKQLDVYRGYAKEGAQQHWGGDQLSGATDPDEVAQTVADATARAGVHAVNLRVHLPGVTPEGAREQIVRLGDELLGPLRKAMR